MRRRNERTKTTATTTTAATTTSSANGANGVQEDTGDLLDEVEQEDLLKTLHAEIIQQQQTIIRTFRYLCLATSFTSILFVVLEEFQLLKNPFHFLTLLTMEDLTQEEQQKSNSSVRLCLWLHCVLSVLLHSQSYQYAAGIQQQTSKMEDNGTKTSAQATMSKDDGDDKKNSSSKMKESLSSVVVNKLSSWSTLSSFYLKVLVLVNILFPVMALWQARRLKLHEVVFLHQAFMGANIITTMVTYLIRWDYSDSTRALQELEAHKYRYKSL